MGKYKIILPDGDVQINENATDADENSFELAGYDDLNPEDFDVEYFYKPDERGSIIWSNCHGVSTIAVFYKSGELPPVKVTVFPDGEDFDGGVINNIKFGPNGTVDIHYRYFDDEINRYVGVKNINIKDLHFSIIDDILKEVSPPAKQFNNS